MFDTVRNEVAARVLEVRDLLLVVAANDQSSGGRSRTRGASATCKGLLFVHLYGVYEYAITSTVQTALDTMRAAAMSCRAVRRSLLALVLDSTWDGVSKAGRKKLWAKRVALIATMDDDKPMATLSDTMFPYDGSQFRKTQLETIWQVFGIDVPVLPDERLKHRIDGLVENRNAIAHGRRTASEVGRDYTSAELGTWVTDIDSIVQYIIDTMNAHCSSGGLDA